MSNESPTAPAQDQLAITLNSAHMSVSYLSSLLRVLQATLREVAMSNDGTRRQLDQRPRTILMLSGFTVDGDVTLLFTFADSRDSTPLRQLSSQIFDAFFDRFSEFVKGLPQPGLWGSAARRSPRRASESTVVGRMDQMHRELRRSTKAAMRFRGRSIEIEGDRMEMV